MCLSQILQSVCGWNKLETAYTMNALSFFSVDRISKVLSSFPVKQPSCAWKEAPLICCVRSSHKSVMNQLILYWCLDPFKMHVCIWYKLVKEHLCRVFCGPLVYSHTVILLTVFPVCLSSAGWAGQSWAGPESARASPEHRGSGKNEQPPPAVQHLCVCPPQPPAEPAMPARTTPKHKYRLYKNQTLISPENYQIMHRLSFRCLM